MIDDPKEDSGEREDEDRGASRREFFRVSTRLPVRASALEVADIDRVKMEILAPDPTPPDLDLALREWLERIEEKIDGIYAALDPRRRAPLSELDRRDLELSASGASWSPDTPIALGEWVLIELLITLPHRCRLRALAECVGERALDDGTTRSAFAFRTIKQGDRDAIVAHALEIQRSQIRHGRAEVDES